MSSDWTIKFFIDKAHLFLKIMNIRWGIAEREAKGIAKILSNHGISKGRILDLMCGNGRIAINLAKLGYNVVGVDFSPLYIEDANKKAIEHGVEDKTSFLVGDIRNLNSIIKDNIPFDGVINVWTSIGYYDESTDEMIFRKAAKLCRDNALLIIASTASRDFLLRRFLPRTIEEWEDLVVIEDHKFEKYTSRLKSTWRFYNKRNEDLVYIDKLELDIRLYSIHELNSLLRKAGWQIIESYKDLFSLEPGDPTDPINIVAKKIS